MYNNEKKYIITNLLGFLSGNQSKAHRISNSTVVVVRSLVVKSSYRKGNRWRISRGRIMIMWLSMP